MKNRTDLETILEIESILETDVESIPEDDDLPARYQIVLDGKEVQFPQDATADDLFALAKLVPKSSEAYRKVAQAMDYSAVRVASDLTFEGLNRRTATELRCITDTIVLDGVVPPKGSNYMVDLLMAQINTSPSVYLLELTTVFPTRAYLSLLRYQESKT